MTRIEINSGKLNLVPQQLDAIISSLETHNTNLSSIQKQCLNIRKSICNLQDIEDTINTSAKEQEEAIRSFKEIQSACETFAQNAAKTDEKVETLIEEGFKGFYADNPHLKPDSEKSIFEHIGDGLSSVGEWCAKHWKEILIGIAVIVVYAALTALTAGTFVAFAPALLVGLKAALIGGLISGGISTAISVIDSVTSGQSFGAGLSNALGAFGDGFASGFMFGGLFVGGSTLVAYGFKFSSKLKLKELIIGKFKLWSPNTNSPNIGGTLFKIGKTFRLDFEAGKQLFHTHLSKSTYNRLPQFVKSAKWLIDSPKNGGHIRLTGISGGVTGAFQN